MVITTKFDNSDFFFYDTVVSM